MNQTTLKTSATLSLLCLLAFAPTAVADPDDPFVTIPVAEIGNILDSTAGGGSDFSTAMATFRGNVTNFAGGLPSNVRTDTCLESDPNVTLGSDNNGCGLNVPMGNITRLGDAAKAMAGIFKNSSDATVDAIVGNVTSIATNKLAEATSIANATKGELVGTVASIGEAALTVASNNVCSTDDAIGGNETDPPSPDPTKCGNTSVVGKVASAMMTIKQSLEMFINSLDPNVPCTSFQAMVAVLSGFVASKIPCGTLPKGSDYTGMV